LNEGQSEKCIGLVGIDRQRLTRCLLSCLRATPGHGYAAINTARERIGEQTPSPGIARLKRNRLPEVFGARGVIEAQRVRTELHESVEPRVRTRMKGNPADSARDSTRRKAGSNETSS